MKGKIYNYEKHIGDMLNMNQYECENSSKSIWFLSLLIWLDMKQTSLVSPPKNIKNLPIDRDSLTTYKKSFLHHRTFNYPYK